MPSLSGGSSTQTFGGGDLVGGEVVEYLVQRHVHPHPVLVGEVLGGRLRQQGEPAELEEHQIGLSFVEVR